MSCIIAVYYHVYIILNIQESHITSSTFNLVRLVFINPFSIYDNLAYVEYFQDYNFLLWFPKIEFY